MGFQQLIAKVKQAEDALEAQERRIAADWRQLKASWRQTWTPGRIVLAGLVGGFLVGRAQPLRAAASGGQFVQLVNLLSGLFASGTATVAAEQAEQAAETAGDVAVAASSPAGQTPHAATVAPQPAPMQAGPTTEHSEP